MKQTKPTCTLILLILFGVSCKKTSNTKNGAAALNVIQTTINVPSVVINFSDTAIPYYENQAWLGYGSSLEYGLPAGDNPITIVSSADTLQSLWQGNLSLKVGCIYSLYLSGILAAKNSVPDTLLLQDIIPTYSDSVAGVRFINLSPGSQPMTINIQGNLPSQTEFSSLGYKQISSFKSYPDTNGISTYTFEVRDAATKDLLVTFLWNFTLFRNNTLVIYGSEDSSVAAPVGVLQVNNF